MVQSIRSLGSSALNIAMVAQGGLDIYWYVSPPSAFKFHEDAIDWLSVTGKLDAGHGTCAPGCLSRPKPAVWLPGLTLL
jgi:hypothetical protein